MKYKKEERLRLDIDRQIYDGEITRHQAAVFDIGRNDGQQFPLARIPPGPGVQIEQCEKKQMDTNKKRQVGHDDRHGQGVPRLAH